MATHFIQFMQDYGPYKAGDYEDGHAERLDTGELIASGVAQRVRPPAEKPNDQSPKSGTRSPESFGQNPRTICQNNGRADAALRAFCTETRYTAKSQVLLAKAGIHPTARIGGTGCT